MAKESIISIKNLNVTYFAGRSNEVRALQGISLDIFPGEFIIFFGPSGCGKSTLLYSIAGLELNVEGDIVVKGKNLSGMKLSDIEVYHQRVIGMIFQSFYLISSLSIAQNVALPQVAVRKPPSERIAKAMELLNKFGVGPQASKLPSELSGGQQQRVAICRSLMNDPDVLIGDEPTGNLDSKSSQDVMVLLRHLNDVDKKTVILVTHDPSHLRHAHRIFYLRDGKITGTKTNTEEERNREQSAPSVLSASTLSHWARAYAPTDAEEKKLVAFSRKAEQIMAEVLTGLTVEEMNELGEKIGAILEHGKMEKNELTDYLHTPAKQGGIGMNKLKAQRLDRDMGKLIKEILALQKPSKRKTRASDDNLTLTMLEAQELRRYLLTALDIRLSGPAAVHAMDDAIRLRLENTYDRLQVQEMLDRSISRKGAGLDSRVARLISRKLEPLITTPSTSPLAGHDENA